MSGQLFFLDGVNEDFFKKIRSLNSFSFNVYFFCSIYRNEFDG